MQPIFQELEVRFRYPVHFTEGLFDPANRLLRDVVAGGSAVLPAKLLFVLDAGALRSHPGLARAIEEYCGEHSGVLSLVRPPLPVPGGERVKNEHEWVLDLHREIERAGICRQSYVAAVGGGAVLDMAGLAAATAHRGVRLIRIPTTVLAQNDSGVGVKNGINAFGKKNFLGTFAPPFAVLNDFRFLATLSDRDWRGGIAEAVKVAAIRDAAFFGALERDAAALAGRDMEAMQRLVYRCAELHLAHIARGGDPFETGSSRPLDFGHWAAHRLERLSGYRLRHGEAVAIGIALDTTYSYLAGFLPEADWRRVLALLSNVGFALSTPELYRYVEAPDHPECVLRGLEEFREHLGGELTITLLRGIGRGFDVHQLDAARIVESLALLRGLNQNRPPHLDEPEPTEATAALDEHAPDPCRAHGPEGDENGSPISPTRHLSAEPPAGDRRVLPREP